MMKSIQGRDFSARAVVATVGSIVVAALAAAYAFSPAPFFQTEPLGLGLALLLAHGLYTKPLVRYAKPIAIGLLALIAGFSAARYFQIAHIQHHHGHELYHYVIGGKYFRYLGYEGLYPATAQTLVEQGLDPRTLRVRNLSDKTQAHDPDWPAKARVLLADMPDPIRASFQRDIALFSEQFDQAGIFWRTALHDHGFNPSPLWVLQAMPILQGDLPTLFPWLIYLDYFLVAASGLLLLFLLPPGYWRWLMAAIYWLVLAYYPAVGVQAFAWTVGGFLRYTWFFYLALGIFFSAREQYFRAGIFLMLAGLERVFPLAFYGVGGLYLAFEAFKSRAWTFPLARFPSLPVVRFAAGGLAVVLVSGALMLATYPASTLTHFIRHISAHDQNVSNNDVGFSKLAAYSGTDQTQETWAGDEVAREKIFGKSASTPEDQTQRIFHQRASQHMIARGAALFSLALLAFVVFRYLAFLEGMMLGGAGLLFYFTGMSYYYQVFLALHGAVLVVTRHRRPSAALSWHAGYFGAALLGLTLIPWVLPGIHGTSVAISLVMGLLFPLIASAYHWPRFRHQALAILLAMAGLGAILLPNFRDTPAEASPFPEFHPVLRFNGLALKSAMPNASTAHHVYLDPRGHRIAESGLFLNQGGEFFFPLALPAQPQRAYWVVLRGNFGEAGVLGLAVNGQTVIDAHPFPRRGKHWDYEILPIPATALRPGRNRVTLRLVHGPFLGVYHVWCGEAPRPEGHASSPAPSPGGPA